MRKQLKGDIQITNNGLSKLFSLEFFTILVFCGVAWGINTAKVNATIEGQIAIVNRHDKDRSNETIKQEAIKDQLNAIGRDVSNLQVEVQFLTKSLEEAKKFQDKATEQQNQTLRILCAQFPASCR